MKIRLLHKLKSRLRKKHHNVNLFLSAWEERYTFSDDMMGSYKPRQFLWLFLKAFVLKKKCWHCNGSGRTGYYEPEDCSVCFGFGVNWTGEQEPDWEAMAEDMRKYDLEHENEVEG